MSHNCDGRLELVDEVYYYEERFDLYRCTRCGEEVLADPGKEPE